MNDAGITDAILKQKQRNLSGQLGNMIDTPHH